jgi:hypothetical protein
MFGNTTFASAARYQGRVYGLDLDERLKNA